MLRHRCRSLDLPLGLLHLEPRAERLHSPISRHLHLRRRCRTRTRATEDFAATKRDARLNAHERDCYVDKWKWNRDANASPTWHDGQV